MRFGIAVLQVLDQALRFREMKMSQNDQALPTWIWVNYNDLTDLPHWKSWWMYREIIPFYGRKIQVCELL